LATFYRIGGQIWHFVDVKFPQDSVRQNLLQSADFD